MESGQQQGTRVEAASGQASTTPTSLLREELGQLSLGPADPGGGEADRGPAAPSSSSGQTPSEGGATAAAAPAVKSKGAKRTKNTKAKRQQLCLATCERGRLSLSDPSNLRANAHPSSSPPPAVGRSPLAGRHNAAGTPLSASPLSSSSGGCCGGAASWGGSPRDRAGSDPRSVATTSGAVPFLSPGLKAQHAAHRCKRTGGGPPPGSRPVGLSSPLGASQVRRSPCSPSSAATLSEGSFPSSRRGSESHLASPSFASQRQQKPKGQQPARYEAYMPLCEVQQALKKGEVVEGVLRINPRNYEDSFISAPDSQMDIYIGGLHDRNRALNGDVVAVKIKPQGEWKVLWDRIRLWEEKTKRSLVEDLQGEDGASPDSGEEEGSPLPEEGADTHPPSAPLNSQVIEEEVVEEEEAGKADVGEEEELGGDELPDSPVPSQPNWDGSSPTAGAPRPSDTIEVLGIERLLGQVQEYVENQRRNGNSRRNRSGRHGRLPMPCSLEASLAPLPSALVATTLGGDHPPRPPSRRGLDSAAGDPALADPWATTDDMGSTMVFSPEELLQVPEEERRRQRRASSPSPSRAPPLVGAVAPDELSGEEDWSSDAESTGSTALEQHLEDMAFLRASQDAHNNNHCPGGGVGGGAEDICNNGPDDRQLLALEVDRDLSQLVGLPLQVDDVSVLLDPSLPPTSVQGWSSVDGAVANGGWGKQPLAWEQEARPRDRHDEASLQAQAPAAPVEVAPVTPRVEDGPTGGSGMEEEEKAAAPNAVSDGGGAQQPKKKRKRKPKKKRSSPPLAAAGARTRRDYEAILTVADVLRHPLAKRFVQRTGQVVHVLQAKNSRVTAGCLRLLQDRNPNWVLFSPRDSRFPRLMVPSQECPPEFFERPGDFTSTLFLAEMTLWLPDSNFAQGRLRRLLGPAGDLCVETEALLESHNIDHGEFPPDIFGDLDVGPDWKVPKEELSGRRDFRGQLVFTVDPKTARDLDDAISCRPLPPATEGGEPLWEVGVHIADVSRFVRPGTQLDRVAQQRATSVYLVQEVVPMLPRLLCDHLCSLHPGEDKLTFSVVWSLNAEGRVRSEWFGRSIIRSCCKLSYEHAQDLLDHPERERSPGELPAISDGHTVAEVAGCLGVLRGMTEAMRKRRFAGGALRLDQVKVAFTLTDNFVPVGFSVYEHTESHRLIEELMLLANMAVAHRLYKALPDAAFLRSHPPPDDTQLTEVDVLCQAHGVALDVSSAGSLQASLNSLVGEGDELAHAKLNVLTHLLSKPMRMALYFCAGHREDPASFEHYALNVPLYTHFTSPIRRYADVMVHRQLAAALGCGPLPEGSPSELQQVAEHCNDRKYKARQVQETSVDLFLYAFVEQCGAIEDRAMVVGVQEHCFDVLALTLGMAKRVYCDKLGVQEFVHSTEGGRNSIELRYQSSRHVDQYVAVRVEVFTPLEVRISAQPHEPLKYQVFVKPPPDTVLVPPKMNEKPKGRPGRMVPKR